ncbi:general stress protein [Actinomyces vulturis]|uniref:general stress protein n=1 Tax=Actinomyces vulturis TaxID=1857645 RepID=UPI00083401B1|nr:general stress protein [Actinomyces vulturis]
MTPAPTPNTAPSILLRATQGHEVASFSTYAQAQEAVDMLADSGFPVQALTIVGTDLRQVEHITGRMTWPRVLLSGAINGLWLGVLLTAVFYLTSSDSMNSFTIVGCLALGVLWGATFQGISYAMRRGRRDFTSVSQVIAARYAIMASDQAYEAAKALAHQQGNLTPGGQFGSRRRTERSEDPSVPSTFGSRPNEKPRFGVRLSPEEREQMLNTSISSPMQPTHGEQQGPSEDTNHS